MVTRESKVKTWLDRLVDKSNLRELDDIQGLKRHIILLRYLIYTLGALALILGIYAFSG